MSKLQTTTKYKNNDKLPPVPPGEILRSEFMEPLNLSANKLALHMGVPATRIAAILNEKRAITADTALRLARIFKTSPEFWLNLQANFEVAMLEFSGEKERICNEVRELAGKYET